MIVSRQEAAPRQGFGIFILSGQTSSNGHVVIDPDGNATAIWLENGVVQTASKPLEGSWSTPVSLSGASSSQCRMAIDLTGNVVVVWHEGEYIQSVTRLFGENWQSIPDVISTLGASFPDVAIGGNGDVKVVWQSLDEAIYVTSKRVDGAWGSEEKISSRDARATYPRVAVDIIGNTTAAWFCFNESNGNFTNVHVQSSFKKLDNEWQTPVYISDISYTSVVNPEELTLQVKSYTEGSAIVVWTSSTNGSVYNTEWCVFKFEHWYVPNLLVGLDTLKTSCDVDINARNDAFILGSNYDGTNINIIGGVLNLNTRTDHMDTVWLFSTTGNNMYPEVSASNLGESGYAAGIWVHYNGSYNDIQMLLFRAPIVAPSNLAYKTVGSDYGVMNQYNNELTWTASPSQLVNGYVIFRNGVYVDTVPKTQLSYTDFNKELGETGTYAIFARNIYGLSSNGVYLNYTVGL